MFENFISLGPYCGVAASMSKLGIRSCSGPFDWCGGELQNVLACIESDFCDFLDVNNLELVCNEAAFNDKKYNFYFPHEIKVSFERDYETIYRKYMRRINVFRKQIKRKTCFMRAVPNREELLYIKNNVQHINKVIRKQNAENEIVYIVSNRISGSNDLLYPFFVVDSAYEGRRIEEIRKLFDDNMDLQAFCIENFDEKKRYQNMVFDLQKENRRIEYRYWLITKIETINYNKIHIPKEIIIYGTGTIGKAFYHKIKNKCRILFFMDANPTESSYEGIPVILKNRMDRKYFNTAIVVTPCYEYEEIKEGLVNLYGDLNIIALTDLFETGVRENVGKQIDILQMVQKRFE